MSEKLQKCLSLIDQANNDDPKQTLINGELINNETLYSQRMFNTLQAFVNDASEPLTLACYAQHVCRWKSSRRDYPEGLEGYLKWRTDLAKLHASTLAEAMQVAEYSVEEIKRAKHIIQKRKLKADSEVQTLEDVSCLVFLNYYFGPFASKHSDEKIIDIVQKTWAKMSDNGHQAALKLNLEPKLQTLVEKALS